MRITNYLISLKNFFMKTLRRISSKVNKSPIIRTASRIAQILIGTPHWTLSKTQTYLAHNNLMKNTYKATYKNKFLQSTTIVSALTT